MDQIINLNRARKTREKAAAARTADAGGKGSRPA